MRLSANFAILCASLSLVPLVAVSKDLAGSGAVRLQSGSGSIDFVSDTSGLEQSIIFDRERLDVPNPNKRQHAAAVKAKAPRKAKAAGPKKQATNAASSSPSSPKAKGAAQSARKGKKKKAASKPPTKKKPTKAPAKAPLKPMADKNTGLLSTDSLPLLPVIRSTTFEQLNDRDERKAAQALAPSPAPDQGKKVKNLRKDQQDPKSQAGRKGKSLAGTDAGKEGKSVVGKHGAEPASVPQAAQHSPIPPPIPATGREKLKKNQPAKLPTAGKGRGKST